MTEADGAPKPLDKPRHTVVAPQLDCTQSERLISRASGEGASLCAENKSFPRSLRLRRRGQFLHAQRRGTRLQTAHLIAYRVANKKRPTRLGITVSKKVGRAHQRNRFKRLLREAFRHSELRTMSGFDLSLVAKRTHLIPTRATLISELNWIASQKPKPKQKSKRNRPPSSVKNSQSTSHQHVKSKSSHKSQAILYLLPVKSSVFATSPTQYVSPRREVS